MTATSDRSRPHARRWWPRLGAGAVCVALLRATAWAEDTDDLRFYFGLRVGASFLQDREPVGGGLLIEDTTRNVTGLAVGVNLNRYFGVELSGDYQFQGLRIPGRGKLGEYGMFSLIPQVRLRYPLLEGLLTPYLIGGIGVGFNQFNDPEPPAEGLRIRTTTAAPVAAVGGGIEYFIADNIALGVEGKYLFDRWHELEIENLVDGGRANFDAILLTGGVRLLFPETPAARRIRAPYAGRARFYVGARLGAAIPVNDEIADGVRWTPSYNAVSSGLGVNRLIGVVAGLNIGDYWGVELLAQGYTPQLELRGTDVRFGKYAVYSFLPQLRLRYPILDGRLSPYLLAGVGVAYGEFAHPRPASVELEPVGGEGYAVAATAGAGVDYFVARNVSLALETSYLYARIPGFELRGQSLQVNADAALASLGLRIYFPEARPLWGK
jgi:opacity protein-like surface antigen